MAIIIKNKEIPITINNIIKSSLLKIEFSLLILEISNIIFISSFYEKIEKTNLGFLMS